MSGGPRFAIGWLALACAAAAVLVTYLVQRAPVGEPARNRNGARLELVVSTPEGSPASHARVELAHGGAVRRERTDAGGRARFVHLPPGEVVISVSLPGTLAAERTLSLAPGKNEARVALEPAVRVAGRVVDDRGMAVAGATITALREGEEAARPLFTRKTRSDAEGRFALEGLAKGRYALRVQAELHAFAVVPALQAPHEEPLEVVLERTSRLHGQVLDPDGEPAPHASVTIAGSGVWPPKQIEADAEGRFALEPVPSGVYELRARRGGAVSEPVEGVRVEPASATRIDLRLEPGAALRGRVFDAARGTPLAGARVTVVEDALSGAPFEAETDGDGGFAFEGLRRTPHRVWIRAAGYVAVAGQAAEPGDGVQPFALRRAAVLSGEVVDEQGTPMPHVALEVRGTSAAGEPVRVSPAASSDAPLGLRVLAPPPAGDNLGVVPGAVPKVPLFSAPLESAGAPAPAPSGFASDAAGRFRIEGVPAGRIELVARHPGFAPSRSGPHRVAPGAEVSGLRVVLARGATLLGRVLDAGEQPVPSLLVQLEIEGEPGRATLTGPDGRFRFEAIRGRCTVTAVPQGVPPVRARVDLQSGEQRELVLALPGESHELAGRVLDARGFPIADATLSVAALDARFPVNRSAVSAEDGTFRVLGLPPPPYAVEASHPGYATARLSRVRPDAPGELTLELHKGARVHGIVVDRLRNDGVAGARVRLRRGKALHSARTDAQGRFEFSNITSGNYDVIVEAKGYVSGRAQASVQGGEARELDPIVLAPGGSVSGDVVDRLGAPVFDAEIAVGLPTRWDRSVRTDHRGHFRLEALPPGEHWVSARHPQAGQSPQPELVRVYPLQESPGLVLRLPGQAD